MDNLQGKLTATDPARRFRQLAQAHSLWGHPFVERCRAGRLTVEQVRVLGSQMYRFSREFTRFLAKALAASPHEEARMVIAENLWEELGEGDPERSHVALFRRFTRALGLSDAQLAAIPPTPETAALIDTYLGLSDRYGVIGILGALCYASEGIVGALYSQIEAGLLSTIAFEPDDLVFFDEHIRVDDGHADHLEAVLLPCLGSPREVEIVEAAIQEALDARCRFFDGVLRAAARHEGVPVLATAN